ncbi:hypothetical protein tb265_46340 [Gemmatimonadetes bacterium T265]|nr:hypothetical protein tb265_46340 [Gemmatimonadetes bacterium T265]
MPLAGSRGVRTRGLDAGPPTHAAMLRGGSVSHTAMKVPSLRAARHVDLWLGVFAGWLVATRAYHPTLAIAAGATAVLVGASAAAVYANHRLLGPRFAAGRRPRWSHVASVLALVGLLDLIAVPAIQLISAWLWHPDPRRFGFWFNVASDGAIIAAHVAAAATLAWVLRLRRGAARPTPRGAEATTPVG